ncbi:UvrD-helicase domain-containing protein [Planktothrix agardhii]|uniref:UvrD-helicase domain-containing protein n=1 Tax=Planktothrix agardhii TaxID=1160 RepID=UPI0004051AE5|nr:UvrD-helicase domain-containing protein [Planktothrix agardhii]
MELSNYQESILEFVIKGTGHGSCNAVAGSGKSTTLRIVAQELVKLGKFKPSDIRVIVFGKANSLDLINKFGKGWESSVSTLHSAGWGLLKEHLGIKNTRGLIQTIKYKKIAGNLDLIGHQGNQWSGTLKREKAISKDDDFIKIVDFLRLTNSEATPDKIQEICDHFNIEDIFNYRTIAIASQMVLDRGEKLAKLSESFDFTDQIWLPVKWGLKPRKPFKFVLVDECQDLNAAQLELALSLAADNGRLLFVGDPRQAIMGFAGADNESYNKIVERTNATELPLSVCYRCPQSVIKLVKSLYPIIPIEPFNGAIEGKIKQIKSSEINDHLKVGDLVLSRKTAPLVSLCIKLISKGIAATVKGKAIGEQIKKDLEAIGNIYGFTYDKFNEFLSLYKKSKAERYKGLDNEERLLEDLNDKCEALETIYKSQVNCKSVYELGNYIDDLFSDEHSPIILSTAHRAKGLENERVFIIKPEDMPLVWRNQKSWEYEQECNLHYVALTRAKSELIIVGNPDWLEDETSNCEQTQIEEPKLIPLEQTSKREIAIAAIKANPELSARAIADQIGVSNNFISKLKKSLIENGELLPNQVTDKRGRKINTERIGINAKKISIQDKVAKIVERSSKDEIKELIKMLKTYL